MAAKTALRKAVAAMRAAKTGSLQAASSFEAVTGPRREDFSADGRFDLGSDEWRWIVSEHNMTGRTAAEETSYEAEVIGTSNTLYIKVFQSKPPEPLDSWRRWSVRTPDVSAEAFALVPVLQAVRPKKIEPGSPRGAIITGTLPAYETACLFGLRYPMGRAHYGPSDVRGSAPITVTLDADGLPERISIERYTLRVTGGAAAQDLAFVETAESSEYAATFSLWAAPSGILLPHVSAKPGEPTSQAARVDW